jgi:prepilin-type N-terminal cleavage/methylation domain-containing protein
VRAKKGFTLIELLIVVVIIGILAAIAIPKFVNSKEKAYVASMKSDLRTLWVAQEGYAADHDGQFFNGAVPAPGLEWEPSAGVTVTLVNVGPGGWGASATHSGTGQQCAVYNGSGGPVGPASAEAQVTCN